jgi:hypothetical protein
MVTPFWVSNCIIFQGCACLNVSHLKILKEFHNIFVYYIKQDIRIETISLHFIKSEIGIYLWK